jgi:hypothetical protein
MDEETPNGARTARAVTPAAFGFLPAVMRASSRCDSRSSGNGGVGSSTGSALPLFPTGEGEEEDASPADASGGPNVGGAGIRRDASPASVNEEDNLRVDAARARGRASSLRQAGAISFLPSASALSSSSSSSFAEPPSLAPPPSRASLLHVAVEGNGRASSSQIFLPAPRSAGGRVLRAVSTLPPGGEEGDDEDPVKRREVDDMEVGAVENARGGIAPLRLRRSAMNSRSVVDSSSHNHNSSNDSRQQQQQQQQQPAVPGRTSFAGAGTLFDHLPSPDTVPFGANKDIATGWGAATHKAPILIFLCEFSRNRSPKM